ncbi:hypothetical protein ACFVYT_40075 [Streptomyces sp. NPDC058290]|uniref:hypothetical protein n=1 Tax=Streptomyces sp. NPDC058290 TaxID=3346426 RepID=UPI0036E40979
MGACDDDALVIAEGKGRAECRPARAAIGFGLASAFGTGGRLLRMMVVEAVGDAQLWPVPARDVGRLGSRKHRHTRSTAYRCTAAHHEGFVAE